MKEYEKALKDAKKCLELGGKLEPEFLEKLRNLESKQ